MAEVKETELLTPEEHAQALEQAGVDPALAENIAFGRWPARASEATAEPLTPEELASYR